MIDDKNSSLRVARRAGPSFGRGAVIILALVIIGVAGLLALGDISRGRLPVGLLVAVGVACFRAYRQSQRTGSAFGFGRMSGAPSPFAKPAGLGWKIFGLLLMVFLLMSILRPTAPPGGKGVVDIASTALSVPATVGVLLYAFNKRPRNVALWSAFSWIYALVSVVIVAVSIQRLVTFAPSRHVGAVGIILAVGIVAALQFFIWLGLRRYSLPEPDSVDAVFR